MNRSHCCPTLKWPLILSTLCALLVLVAVAVSAGQARAGGTVQATIIGGDITTDTTWTTAGSPYIVTALISVTNAATLTIEPGVEVLFVAGAGIHIDGGLNVQGTHARQVRMHGDNGVTWQGLTAAQPAGNIRLQSATIRNAAIGLAIQGPAGVPGRPGRRVDVLDSLFESNNIGVGVDYSLLANPPRLTLRNSLLTNNQLGVRIIGPLNGNAKLKFNHNSFVGNGIGVNALNIAGKGLNMRQQWWGDANGPGDPAACANPPAPGTSTRDLVCGNVDFTPWSKVPAGRVLLPAGQGIVIESALGQAALSDDDLAPTSIMTLTVPLGTFTQTVDLLASARAFASSPPGQPTQLTFELTAAANGQEIHRFANNRQLRLEIRYLPDDLGPANPQKLRLYYFDETLGLWSTAGITTTPDPANQRVIARLEHLTRYRVMDSSLTEVLLPLVMR